MAETLIEWAHFTFNPWRGCTKVSDGCKNCYAEKMSKRNPSVLGEWGPGAPRVLASESYWKQPLKWNRDAKKAGERRRVFCASLADVFDAEVPNEWRERLFSLVERTPSLDWLILTKRPENIESFLAGYVLPDNVWLGVSVENQKAADERIPILLQIPAAVRFLSVEPLLGPVAIRDHLMAGADPGRCVNCGKGHGFTRCPNYGGIAPTRAESGCCEFRRQNFAIDWVIVGGESGHGARPMHPDWARSLRDQCQAADVPFFFKQHGEWREAWDRYVKYEADADDLTRIGLLRPGGDFRLVKDLPLSPQETHCTEVDAWMIRLGKKAAGRVLDGRTWDGYPAPSPGAQGGKAEGE